MPPTDTSEPIPFSAEAPPTPDEDSFCQLHHQTCTLLESTGAVRSLDYLAQYHYSNTNLARTADPQLQNDHPTHLEEYFYNEDPSPLRECPLWEQALELSKTPLSAFNPSTKGSKTLYDHIPDEERREIERTIASLKSLQTIKDQIEKPIENLCTPFYEALKSDAIRSDEEKLKQIASLIFGEKIADQKRQIFADAKSAIHLCQHTASLAAPEKVRIAVHAITAAPEDRDRLVKEAALVFNQDNPNFFQILEAQVKHLTELVSQPSPPFNPDTTALFAPEFLSFLNATPSDALRLTVLKGYQRALENHDDIDGTPITTLSPRAQQNEIIGLTISSLSLMEQARTYHSTQYFEQIRLNKQKDPELRDGQLETVSKMLEDNKWMRVLLNSTTNLATRFVREQYQKHCNAHPDLGDKDKVVETIKKAHESIDRPL